jgi:hypothetical protein
LAEEERRSAAALRKVCTPDHVLWLDFPQSAPAWAGCMLVCRADKPVDDVDLYGAANLY